MAEISPTDLSSVPIRALRATTIAAISLLLDPVKVIPNDEGLPRDWRGLAHVAGLHGNAVPLISSKKDPTNQVLHLWTKGTVEMLKAALQQLDRWDIVDDTETLMEKDALHFRMETNENSVVLTTDVNLTYDKQIITIGDVNQLEKGFIEPQFYHAFLLYADEDSNFASLIVNKLETEYGLKLCIRDRDLVGGLAFEHEAIMRLIKERCNRLIVIVSPSFLKSEANKFFVTFAQALGIDQRHRKVIPCIYERCILPPELSYYFPLDYTRQSDLWDFWAKLRDSIQTSLPRTIKEWEREENKNKEAIQTITPTCKDFGVDSSFKSSSAEDSICQKVDFLHVTDDTLQENPKPKSKNLLKRFLKKQKLRKKAE